MKESFEITEYLGDPNLTSVDCVFKRLYSDFIVIEMPKEGVVLRPDDFDVAFYTSIKKIFLGNKRK